MSVIQTYPFNSAVDYNLSNAQISGGKAKLSIIPNPSQLFQQTFSSDTGFTYDNTKSEFTGGLVRQKDQRPANAILGATYTSTKDLNWITSGSTTATDIGSPVLSGGKIQCRGGGNVAVKYTSPAIASASSVGAIKIKHTPNYSGTPSINTNIFEIYQAASNNDRIVLFHGSTGPIRISIFNNVGGIVHSAVNLGAIWSPVAGTEYELELNWNSTNGEIRLFVDGVLRGATPTTVFTRDGKANNLNLGAGNSYFISNGDFNDVLLFSTVQHTSGYTPGYTVPETIYYENTVVLPNFTYTGLGTIQAIESSTITESGAPRYIVGGQYWNGSAWVLSDNTYNQANNSSDTIANITSLVVTGSTTVPVKILFPNSNTQSSVDLISVTVTGQKYSSFGYVEPIVGLQVQGLVNISLTKTDTVNSFAKIILKIAGVLKWWNGTSWATSDGTFAQANTSAEINANLATLILSVNTEVIPRWVLTTSSNIETAEIDESIIEYNFGALFTNPAKCLVYGYYLNISGQPVSEATVTFSLKRATTGEYKEASNNIIEKPVVVTTDVNGYFEAELIRSSEYQGTAIYRVEITKEIDSLNTSRNADKTRLEFQAPDLSEVDLTSLLTAI